MGSSGKGKLQDFYAVKNITTNLLETIKALQTLATRSKKIQKLILVYQYTDTNIKIQENPKELIYPLTGED